MSDEDRLKADWAEVLMTKGGRRIVIRLLAATNLLATCHVPGDTHGTAFLGLAHGQAHFMGRGLKGSQERRVYLDALGKVEGVTIGRFGLSV